MTNTKNINSTIYNLAIVGAGFAGIACAYQVTKSAQGNSNQKNLPISIALIEQGKNLACGLAYGTELPEQILNVKAGMMGIDPAEPEGFFKWLQAHGHGNTYSESSFVPRYIYGNYLKDIFASIKEKLNTNLEIVRAEVVDIIPNDQYLDLIFSNGEQIRARAVVLALGNLPSKPSFLNNSQQNLEFARPELASSYTDLEKLDSIALLGSGLTAVDVVVTAEARGFRGQYHIFSRHGLLPMPHLEPQVDSSFSTQLFTKLVSQPQIGFREICRIFKATVEEGAEWIELARILYDLAPNIWHENTTAQKQSFLRHLRPYWEVVRHRIPLENWELLQGLIQEKRLFVRAGEIKKLDRKEKNTEITFRPRKTSQLNSISAARTFNCLGLAPTLRAAQAESVLLNNLVKNGIVTGDELGIGVSTDLKGQVKTAKEKWEGKDLPIYVLGSLRRGELMESTAVRAVRGQAEVVLTGTAGILPAFL